MPAVREPSDGPEPLEIVEVRPGVRLKLNAADKKAWQEHEAGAAETRRVWGIDNATDYSGTKEQVIAGPAVDGPIDAEPTPDADEAAVVSTPKPRSTRKK